MVIFEDDLFSESLTNEEPEAPGISASHWKCEHFIPLRKAELVRLLSRELPADEQHKFQQLCHLIATNLHFEFHGRLEELKQLYAHFNPDAVTIESEKLNITDRERLLSSLFLQFTSLLQRANYQRLTHQQIEQAVEAASDWGMRLQLEFDVFRRLEVFARGDVMARRVRRRWHNLFMAEEMDVPIYRRLVVMFFLRPHQRLDRSIDTEQVYLKLFKNIPKQDVDMLLPGGHFHMSWVDRGKILIPTLSGIGLATAKLVLAWVFAPLVLLGFVGGTIGYGVKSFLGYMRTKDRYQLALTQSLYYQNLDNNAGVLFRLLDEADEQECRESILAYALLRRGAPESGWKEADLDRRAEQFLRETLGFDVDFEVHDALEKLKRLECARSHEGHWHAASLDQAIKCLGERWDSLS